MLVRVKAAGLHPDADATIWFDINLVFGTKSCSKCGDAGYEGVQGVDVESVGGVVTSAPTDMEIQKYVESLLNEERWSNIVHCQKRDCVRASRADIRKRLEVLGFEYVGRG